MCVFGTPLELWQTCFELVSCVKDDAIAKVFMTSPTLVPESNQVLQLVGVYSRRWRW